MTRRERLIYAAGALGLGVAFSFAMSRWQPPYLNPSPNQAYVWLFTLIPFVGLAGLIVAGLSRSTSALGWIVLATLTGLAYAAGANQWWAGVSANAALFFQSQHFANDPKRLLASRLNEATGVDDNDIGAIGLGDQRIAILGQPAEHPL